MGGSCLLPDGQPLSKVKPYCYESETLKTWTQNKYIDNNFGQEHNSAIQKLTEESEATKDKYIDVLEENRELRKRIETLEAELSGKSPG